jgi:hypothetical protein
MLTLITTVTVALITAVIGPIAVSWVKLKMEKKSPTTPMHDALESSTLIDTQLEMIMKELECDRIWIAQFHNGGYYYPTGKSIQKFSMFYETVTNGVDSVKMLFQNIPVSLFSPSVNKILEDNTLSVADFKDDNEKNYGLRHTAEETGCKSVYIAGIRDINNKLIGSLGIEYTKRKKSLDLEQIQSIELEATQIGGVLHNHLCEK